MIDIREYAEELPVEIKKLENRWIIHAKNEAGFNCTQVDLVDVIEYVRENMPELLEGMNQKGVEDDI